MAKSELLTACRPSLPAMPTPTCASWIMGTSLAPSPTESVTGCGEMPSRTRRTICAFCAGLTRHAMSTELPWAMSSNCSLVSSLSMKTCNAFPEIMSAFRPGSSKSQSLWSSSRFIVPSSSSMMRKSMEGVSTLVLKPMFRAVSNLSPVRTQSLMPAARIFSMVSGTPSWSLSSIAVVPKMSKLTSMSSATSANFCSRCLVSRMATS
mmetsp:Transcript_79386/g.227778  ORF Transcript_79386/g.227778 Transcript_79386/m.227778 type:complete len:207 (-) Transcript_79386:1823-2443(-)